jgi:hypothetical protein
MEEQQVKPAETTTQKTPQEIIDTLFAERDQYQQATGEQRTTINDIYLAYIGKIVDTTPEDVSKSKENTNKLRTEISYITPSIFSGQPEFEIEGIGEEDKDLATVLERIVNFRFNTIKQCYEKIEAWVKQSAGYGTSIIKPFWKFQTKQNEDGSETPIADEPDLEVSNLLDCFYNPVIPDVENQNSLIFRSVLSLQEVKANQAYDFVGTDGQLNREKVESSGSAVNQYDSSQQTNSDGIELKSASKGTVEIFERITRDRIQTVANCKDRLVLRDVANPYGFINAVKLTHEPNIIPNRFDGFGVGQNTLGLGKLYNKMLNRTLDSVALTNNPFFLFKKGAHIDKKQLVVRPGGGVEVEGDKPLAEYIQPIQFPDVKQGAIAIMDKIDDEHKRASGANDLLQGAASNKTLGQDEIASTYSSNRFELINRRFKHALADVAEMILKMELQNLQSIDAPILRIFPQEIRAAIFQLLVNEAQNIKWNIRVKGNTNVAKNKDMQIKQLNEAYAMFGQILPPENQMEWAKKILELRGIDEIDRLVPDPQQYAEQQAMQQQQAMMQQSM